MKHSNTPPADIGSAKIRLTRKYINANKLQFEQDVIVKLQNSNEYLCRVAGFNDIITVGCSFDPMICDNYSDDSSSLIDTIKPILSDDIITAKSISFEIQPINPAKNSFYNTEHFKDFIVFYLNNRIVSNNSHITLSELNTTYYRIEKTTQFDLTYSKTTVNPIVGYDGLVLQIFNALQTPKSVGVLIRGEHGSGKTTMAKYCSHQTNKKVIVHSPYQVIETPEVLLQPYTNCIIIIDNIDELLKDHSLLLLNSIRQHIQNNDVICTTTKSIPPAFTSSELLSISVNITTPTVDIRKQILSTFQTIPIDILEPLAKKTVGYLPRDLILLHNDAMAWQETTFQNDIYSAYLHAMTFITPSVMIGSETEYDKLTWNDIGGLSNVKEAMIEAVEWPMTHSEQFKKLNIRPSHGVLLYGPSGCAKTSIVRATATMLNTAFITLSSATIYSPFVGDAEASVRDTFRKARAATPCIIFIDEIDTVVGVRSGGSGGDSVRDRVLSTLLNEMDGIEEINGVILIAASNRKDLIDPALLRPGRFDCLIEVPLPDEFTRSEIFKVALKDIPVVNIDYDELAKLSIGKTGADIKWIVSEACTKTLRNDINATVLEYEMLKQLL